MTSGKTCERPGCPNLVARERSRFCCCSCSAMVREGGGGKVKGPRKQGPGKGSGQVEMVAKGALISPPEIGLWPRQPMQLACATERELALLEPHVRQAMLRVVRR